MVNPAPHIVPVHERLAPRIHGHAAVFLLAPDGRVRQFVCSDNLVVNGGLDQVAKRLGGITANPVGFMALGSSTTAVTAVQTALVAEAAGGVRQAVAPVLVSPGQLQLSATWSPSQNANTTINEIGLFDLVSGGVMFSRLVLANPVTKDQEASLQVLYTITFVPA